MVDQVIIMIVVTYLAIGFYAAIATMSMVSRGVLWEDATLVQKIRRCVLFPNITLVHYLRPHVSYTELAKSKPTFDDLLILKRYPWLYCIFLWPLTVVLFSVFIVMLVGVRIYMHLKGDKSTQ